MSLRILTAFFFLAQFTTQQEGFGPIETPQESEYGQSPIVVDWTYIYQDGKAEETDKILADWFHYYEELGEFNNGVLSFLFAHISGGIRHVAIF